MKCKRWFFVLALMPLLTVPALAQQDLTVKMRFLEGARTEKQSAPVEVTSSFLRPTITANLTSKFLLAEEKEQEALYAIGELLNDDEISKAEKRQMWQARMRILQAMTKQVVAKLQLRQGLEKLAEAVELLTAQTPDPEPNMVIEKKPMKK